MFTCKIDRKKSEICVFKETILGTLEENKTNLVPLLSSGTVLNKPCVGILAKLIKGTTEKDITTVFNCVTEDNIRKAAFIEHPNVTNLVMLDNLRPLDNLDILYFLLGFICGNLNDSLIKHFKDNTFNDFELSNSNIPSVKYIKDIFTLIPHKNNDYTLLQEYTDMIQQPLSTTRLYLLPEYFSVMFCPSETTKEYILNNMTIDDLFEFTLSLCDFFDISPSLVSKAWSNTIFFVEVS